MQRPRVLPEYSAEADETVPLNNLRGDLADADRSYDQDELYFIAEPRTRVGPMVRLTVG
jgi:hypothetical protein